MCAASRVHWPEACALNPQRVTTTGVPRLRVTTTEYPHVRGADCAAARARRATTSPSPAMRRIATSRTCARRAGRPRGRRAAPPRHYCPSAPAARARMGARLAASPCRSTLVRLGQRQQTDTGRNVNLPCHSVCLPSHPVCFPLVVAQIPSISLVLIITARRLGPKPGRKGGVVRQQAEPEREQAPRAQAPTTRSAGRATTCRCRPTLARAPPARPPATRSTARRRRRAAAACPRRRLSASRSARCWRWCWRALRWRPRCCGGRGMPGPRRRPGRSCSRPACSRSAPRTRPRALRRAVGRLWSSLQPPRLPVCTACPVFNKAAQRAHGFKRFRCR